MWLGPPITYPCPHPPVNLLQPYSQRVLYNGQEMAPSRFEVMCGKPDAKKWKMSFWRTDADGEPIEVRGRLIKPCSDGKPAKVRMLALQTQCPLLSSFINPLTQSMHDWLSRYGLDRKALDALARNSAAHEAYESHVAGTGGCSGGRWWGWQGTGGLPSCGVEEELHCLPATRGCAVTCSPGDDRPPRFNLKPVCLFACVHPHPCVARNLSPTHAAVALVLEDILLSLGASPYDPSDDDEGSGGKDEASGDEAGEEAAVHDEAQGEQPRAPGQELISGVDEPVPPLAATQQSAAAGEGEEPGVNDEADEDEETDEEVAEAPLEPERGAPSEDRPGAHHMAESGDDEGPQSPAHEASPAASAQEGEDSEGTQPCSPVSGPGTSAGATSAGARAWDALGERGAGEESAGMDVTVQGIEADAFPGEPPAEAKLDPGA